MKRVCLFTLALSLLLAWGCAKKTETVEAPSLVVETETEEVVIVEEAPSAYELYKQRYDALPTTHTVVKGECLWWIAEYQQIYNDPFMWPLIYKANRGQIKNPDLIHPGQTFDIPRYGFTVAELKDVRKSAGAPWQNLMPAETAVLPPDIRQELGYGF